MNTPERYLSIDEQLDLAIKEVTDAQKEYEKLPPEEKQKLLLEQEKNQERMIRMLNETQTFSKELLQRPFEWIR